jgi:DNA-directed RNA polymerase specialized sigma24 family protein
MPTDPTDDVTLWLEQLKAGDPAAVKPLWDAYFARLVVLARQRLRAVPQAVADGEDIALSAFDSFCQGVKGGRFPDLDDRDDMWRLLFVITTRKAKGQVRYHTRPIRGGGRVVHASAVAGDEPGPGVFAGLAGREPTPAFAAEVAEECRRLLAGLESEQLRQLAVWKMEGYTNAEIAEKIGRAVPTVERKLARIRAVWLRTPERGDNPSAAG